MTRQPMQCWVAGGEVLQQADTTFQASYSSKLNLHSFLSHAVFHVSNMQVHGPCIQNRHVIAIEQDYT